MCIRDSLQVARKGGPARAAPARGIIQDKIPGVPFAVPFDELAVLFPVGQPFQLFAQASFRDDHFSQLCIRLADQRLVAVSYTHLDCGADYPSHRPAGAEDHHPSPERAD